MKKNKYFKTYLLLRKNLITAIKKKYSILKKKYGVEELQMIFEHDTDLADIMIDKYNENEHNYYNERYISNLTSTGVALSIPDCCGEVGELNYNELEFEALCSIYDDLSLLK